VDSIPTQLPVAAIDYVSGNIMAFGAMVALARRATVGGSWAVRVSLAAVGAWLARQGMVDDQQFASAPAELPAATLAGLMREISSPFGHVSYLGPVAQMSETPLGSQLPPLPLTRWSSMRRVARAAVRLTSSAGSRTHSPVTLPSAALHARILCQNLA